MTLGSFGQFLRSEENKDLKFAVNFLLQEEICFNAETGQEEPLAIQRLMLRHLSVISSYKVL